MLNQWKMYQRKSALQDREGSRLSVIGPFVTGKESLQPFVLCESLLTTVIFFL